MQLSGKHTAQTTSAKLWKMLMDSNALSRIIPGIYQLEKTGENTYKSLLEIKFGVVDGKFAGILEMENIEVEKSFTLHIQQKSAIGNANASIRIGLSEFREHEVEVNFEGEVKLTGLMATMGNRVVGSISNSLTRQFFANLDRELNSYSV